MFGHLNKKAQSTLEYGIIIAVVVGGLIAMQVYVKRGLQGRLRESADSLGDQFSAQHTTSTRTTTMTSNSYTNTTGGANSTTSTSGNQSQAVNASEEVENLTQEYWK